MTDDLNPVPSRQTRESIAKRVRDTAGKLTDTRIDLVTQTNNAETKDVLSGSGQAPVAAYGTFHKGLTHDEFGRVDREDLRDFVSAINQDQGGSSPEESPFPGTYGSGQPANFDAPIHCSGYSKDWSPGVEVRYWESPLSGHVYSLEGPDADGVAMPPAPKLGSAELTAEMAEVYVSALVRDLPFHDWSGHKKAAKYAALLGDLPFYKGPPAPGEPKETENAKRRREARLPKGATIDPDNMLRGSTPGAQDGPYISQFMLVGNAERRSAELKFAKAGYSEPRKTFAQDGLIEYGLQVIDQRVRPHLAGRDHMTEWTSWLDVQNGANRKSFDLFSKDGSRFITTPRDLATYVHFDALYQAYLNACLILLGEGYGTDVGLPEGGGHNNRDAFATFGGPHILTLVTEVATRALKAVRRQKYNVHLRSRPEKLAAGVSLAWAGKGDVLGKQSKDLAAMATDLDPLLQLVADHNDAQNKAWKKDGWTINTGPVEAAAKNALLPMAFPEGSPMHPAYGAGHATVAGACVTVLKAFFEMYDTSQGRGFSIWDIVNKHGGYDAKSYPAHLFGKESILKVTTGEKPDGEPVKEPAHFVPDKSTGYTSLKRASKKGLSVQGELDKLAANIAIGRDFAGVHYYTDYYESLRMGERIAVGILQEQMLTYREPVSMRFTSFDGDHVMICGTGGTRGLDDTPVFVWDKSGKGGGKKDFQDWWQRHHG